MAKRHTEALIWPMGEHSFFLNIGELRALEQSCDAGVAIILTRLISGGFKVNDVHSTIRLGLQGAGMSEREASKLVARAFDEANYYTLAVTAGEVLRRSIMWDDAETPTGE